MLRRARRSRCSVRAAPCFASGYCLAYGLVTPPDGVDVLLLAPRMVGSSVRRGSSDGYVAYVNVERCVRKGQGSLLGLALAAGALDRAAFAVPAVDEGGLDLFVEQSVGPYVGMAISSPSRSVLLPACYPRRSSSSCTSRARWRRCSAGSPSAASTGRIVEHGATAQYGGFLRTLDLDAESMRARFARCSTTSAAAASPRSSRPRPPPAPLTAADVAMTAGDDPMSRAEESIRAAFRQPSGSL